MVADDEQDELAGLPARHDTGTCNTIAAIIAATAVGQALAYGLIVLFANHLTPESFAIDVAAVAAFLLAGKLASAGIDSITFRVLPSAFASSAWSLSRGFFNFATRRVGSGIVCLLVGFLALPIGRAAGIYGDARAVYQAILVANVAQLILLYLLLPEAGAAGAALAYGAISIFFYARLAITAHRDAQTLSDGEI